MRPNILFIINDQMQAKVFDSDSICQMPHLNQLAKEGVKFDRCYTTFALCSPARASLMTGLLPHNHGMVDCTHSAPIFRADLTKDSDFWSRHLKAAGYNMGYFGKWHVERSESPLNFGWDHFEETESDQYEAYRKSLGLPKEPEITGPQYQLKHKGYRDLPLYGVHSEPEEATPEYFLASQSIKWMKEKAADKSHPWCLFVSTHSPHDPYLVSEEYYKMYDPNKIPKPGNFDDSMKDKPNFYRRLKEVYKDFSWKEYAEAIACYYGYCTMTDIQMGRILQALKDSGQAENTIVIYTSDHGDLMGAHGMFFKGVFPYEESYRIPLIIRAPGRAKAGTVSPKNVQINDLAPTILELAGCGPLSKCDGRSLVPYLEGKTPSNYRNEAYAEFHGHRFFYTQRILWEDDFKYIFNGFDYDELYDLKKDPYELKNLAQDASMKSRAESMMTRMWQIMHATDDKHMVNGRYATWRICPVGPLAGKSK